MFKTWKTRIYNKMYFHSVFLWVVTLMTTAQFQSKNFLDAGSMIWKSQWLIRIFFIFYRVYTLIWAEYIVNRWFIIMEEILLWSTRYICHAFWEYECVFCLASLRLSFFYVFLCIFFYKARSITLFLRFTNLHNNIQEHKSH